MDGEGKGRRNLKGGRKAAFLAVSRSHFIDLSLVRSFVTAQGGNRSAFRAIDSRQLRLFDLDTDLIGISKFARFLSHGISRLFARLEAG